MNKTKEIIEKLGGPKRVAELLDLEYMAVWQWTKRGIPLRHCPTIEKMTHGAITCEDMRPDVFK